MDIQKYIKRFGNFAHVDEQRNLLYIIDYCKSKKLDNNQIAYILATAYHECYNWKKGTHWIPIREIGSLEYFIKKYFLNNRVRRWLGNDDKKDAVDFIGRGYIQITGESNYEKFNIQHNPELALEYKKATEILVDGMINGMFTGVALSKFIRKDKVDFINARRVVNSLDKADLIMNYAIDFLKIL